MAGKISKWVSKRRVKRLAKKGKVTMKSYKGKRHEVKEKAYDKKATKQQRTTLPGSERTGKVSRGAKGAERTKGGTFPKYGKGSKESKSYNSARKKACGDGKGGTFNWQGRSYSCKTKASPNKPGVKTSPKSKFLKRKKISPEQFAKFRK